MVSSINSITFDCSDAARLAAFWAEVTGWGVGPEPSPEFAVVGGSARPADCPSLMFIQVLEGKAAKNRVHLDVSPSGCEQAEELARLLSMGAVEVDVGQGEQTWHVLADPEGNEFCLLRSRVD